MPVYKSKTPTKDGRRYYFSYSWIDNNGKKQRYKSKLYKEKKECSKAEMKFALSVGNVADDILTFSQLSVPFMENKKAHNKITSFKKVESQMKYILSQLGSIKVSKLTVDQYQRFLTYLDSRQLSAKTKNKYVMVLKEMIEFGRKRYNLYTDIPDRFDKFTDNAGKKEMKFLTREQFEQFISVVEDVQFHRLYTILFYCGFRLGERNAITWNDVNFDTNTISINKTVTTKMKVNGEYVVTTPKTRSSYRVLPMVDIVIEELKSLLERFKMARGFNSNWYVFGGYKPIPESTIQAATKKYFKAAGLDPIRLHDFRHSCASYLINNLGCDNIMLISKYLGHGDIQMTLNTYSHLWGNKLDDLVFSINKLEKSVPKSVPKAIEN